MAQPAVDDPRIVSAEWLRSQAATVVIFVPPEYPTALLAQSATATVDVRGTVVADGSLKLDHIASSSVHDAFAAAVREVAPYWLLRPGFSDDCRPQPAEGQVRVWFDVRDGKPVVSFSQAIADKAADKPGVPIRTTRRMKLEYPEDMRRRGLQGFVEAVLRVSAPGEVEEVTVMPSLHGAMARPSLERRLKLWRFQPRPEAEGTACVSYLMEYRFTP